jgi:hypothetical protein
MNFTDQRVRASALTLSLPGGITSNTRGEMKDEATQTPSALQAWASGVMSGSESNGETEADEVVGRAPGQAQYDPADVISVFMSARESAKQRDAQARRNPVRLRRGKSQPS